MRGCNCGCAFGRDRVREPEIGGYRNATTVTTSLPIPGLPAADDTHLYILSRRHRGVLADEARSRYGLLRRAPRVSPLHAVVERVRLVHLSDDPREDARSGRGRGISSLGSLQARRRSAAEIRVVGNECDASHSGVLELDRRRLGVDPWIAEPAVLFLEGARLKACTTSGKLREAPPGRLPGRAGTAPRSSSCLRCSRGDSRRG